jgi:uncharacterized protein with HEPN domain
LSRDEDALLDMLEQIDLILEHGPRDEETLGDDVVVQAATLRWLEIIGEAAGRVTSELRAAHPEVPWRSVIGTRNVVLHGYDRVKLDIVWRVIADDLRPLRGQVAAILEDLE